MKGIDVQQAGRDGKSSDEPQLVALGGFPGSAPRGVFQLPDVGEERPVILVNLQVPQVQKHNFRVLFQDSLGGVGVAKTGGDDYGSPVPDHLLGHRLHFDGLRDILGAEHFDIRKRLLHIVRAGGRGLVPAEVALRTNEDDAHLQFLAFAQWLGGSGKLAGGAEGTARPAFIEDLDELLRRAAAQLLQGRKGQVRNEPLGNWRGGGWGRQWRGGGGGMGLAGAGEKSGNQNNQRCRQDRWGGWEPQLSQQS